MSDRQSAVDSSGDGRKRPETLPFRPRVLAYTDSVAVGGADVNLAILLHALADDVVSTLIVTNPEMGAWYTRKCPNQRVRVIRPVRGKDDLLGIAGHIRAFRRERPHIVHVNANTPWQGHYGIVAGWTTPRARVVVVEQTPYAPGRALQRRLRPFVNGRLAAHVASSDRSARVIEQIFGLSPGSVLTIRAAVPDIAVTPVGRLRHEPTVGYLGRLSPEKGVDVLLRAVQSLPGTAAVLVGDGRSREALERLAAQLGVADRVVITGWREDARSLLATFDVLAAPSRGEGFGNAIVEGMLAAIPVVASDVGGIPEVVADGESGLLVPPDDAGALAAALRSLLENPEHARALGRRGREIALERFHPGRMRASFLDLYATLLR